LGSEMCISARLVLLVAIFPEYSQCRKNIGSLSGRIARPNNFFLLNRRKFKAVSPIRGKY